MLKLDQLAARVSTIANMPLTFSENMAIHSITYDLDYIEANLRELVQLKKQKEQLQNLLSYVRTRIT